MRDEVIETIKVEEGKSCNLCGSPEARLLYVKDGAHLMKCGGCGSLAAKRE